MSKFYVYFLIDPSTNEPFYVGKGCNNRDKQHLKEAKKPQKQWSNSLKCRRINTIHALGHSVIITRLVQNLNEEEAYKIESQYIAEYGRIINNSGILTNISSEDRISPRFYKKVDQYDLNGQYITTFDSVQEAALAVNVTPNTVSGVINGRIYKNKTMRTAGGFKWCHHNSVLDEYDRYDNVYRKKWKKVCQYTLTGKLIAIYDSAKQAGAETGACVHRISSCCHKNRIKSVSGFCWAFENEEPRLPSLSDKRYQKCL